jgi:hypothetical protein
MRTPPTKIWPKMSHWTPVVPIPSEFATAASAGKKLPANTIDSPGIVR